VIVDCLRTAVGKAPRGTLRNSRPDDLGAIVIRALLEKYPAAKDEVEDVILGCAMPEGEAGSNMARQSALRAGLPDSVPAMTSTASAARAPGHRSRGRPYSRRVGRYHHRRRRRIHEHDSAGGRRPAPNPWFVDNWPEVYMSMGLTAERIHRKYAVTREDADAFAMRSHQNALRAQNEGRFDKEIVPVEVENITPGKTDRALFLRDEGPRADTSLEALDIINGRVAVLPAMVPAGTHPQTRNAAGVDHVERLQRRIRARAFVAEEQGAIGLAGRDVLHFDGYDFFVEPSFVLRTESVLMAAHANASASSRVTAYLR